MTNLRRATFVLALAAACGFGVTLARGEDPPMSPEAFWAQAGALNEQHAWLKTLEGSWDAKGKFWMGGPDPMLTSAESEVTVLLGGRWLHQSYKGDFMGMPFEGLATMGYDNLEKRYAWLWIDNMNTHPEFMHGQRDGEVLTLRGTHLGPGGSAPARSVVTRKGDDEFVYENFEGNEGAERKTMEIVYTRKP